MLAIARALMARPRLLLLDEPSLRPGAADRAADLRRHQNAQRARRPHRVPGRAECLPCAQARPPRLCHGQRVDHAVRERGANCWSGPRSSRPISKAAAHDDPAFSIPELLYEEGSFGVFLLVTVILGGGAAALSGRAIAETWRPWWQVVAYSFILGAAVRFFHFSLFGGTLLSLPLLFGRQRGLHGLRILRVSGRPRRPNGHAISLDQRGARPSALAPQAALK